MISFNIKASCAAQAAAAGGFDVDRYRSIDKAW
jgi:hypothetical protein